MDAEQPFANAGCLLKIVEGVRGSAWLSLLRPIVHGAEDAQTGGNRRSFIEGEGLFEQRAGIFKMALFLTLTTPEGGGSLASLLADSLTYVSRGLTQCPRSQRAYSALYLFLFFCPVVRKPARNTLLAAFIPVVHCSAPFTRQCMARMLRASPHGCCPDPGHG